MQLLYTRDGTAYGNGIVICEVEPSIMLRDYLKGRPLWLIETDYGNRFRLTDREIDEFFVRGYSMSYELWDRERQNRRTLSSLGDRGDQP